MRRLVVLPLFLLLLACSSFSLASDDLGPEANAILKPLVRVRTTYSGGSGTIVYSEDREKSGEFRTFVLTNHHVVDDAIHVVKSWDSLHEKWVSAEENNRVEVEVFIYLRGGKTVISQPIPADIRAHNEGEDLAILELDYPLQLRNVAKLLPPTETLRLLMPVCAVGCSLGEDPLVTTGHINDLEEMIERKSYVMASADIIWGNSGGAVFVKLRGEFYFVGVPSRVAVAGYQAATHMGYFVPVDRIQRWFAKEKLTFLLNETTTPTEAFAAREALKEKED